MRMWMLEPSILCRQHLLGEHVELHMLVGTIRRGVSLTGYLARGLIDTAKISARHDALVEEMTRRGYNHKSPLEYDDELALGSVDLEASMLELMRRCSRCSNGER